MTVTLTVLLTPGAARFLHQAVLRHHLPPGSTLSHGLRAQLPETAPTSDGTARSRSLGDHTFCLTWLHITGSHDVLRLGFDCFLEQLTALQKTLTYVYLFTI